jgi:hypothetical protein
MLKKIHKPLQLLEMTIIELQTVSINIENYIFIAFYIFGYLINFNITESHNGYKINIYQYVS